MSRPQEDAEGTDEFITFLQGFLLAFGGIALFVGAFVIANSLSITIAQRTREIATLRTLGGSRRQVLRAIVLESLIVGVLASVVGLFAGLALAKLLFWLFDAVGFTLPNTGLVFQTRTIVVALLVGILVTLFASLRPAIRATRVPPIAAVREGAELPPGRLARFRTVGAALLAGIGFAAIAYGLFADGLGTTEILVSMGVGALLVFLGVSLFAAKLVPALATALGWPSSKLGGAAGDLARGNAKRNPNRTAQTAAALMIGLALVTLVAVLGAGIRATFNEAVDSLARGEFYAITAQNNFSPIPIAASRAAESADGVQSVSSVRAGEALIFGDNEFLTGATPNLGDVITLDWVEGSQAVFAELDEDGAFVDEGFAEEHELSVGSPVEVLTPTGAQLDLEVLGIFDPPPGGSPFGAVTVSSATFDENYTNPKNVYSFVTMDGGVTDENQESLESTLVGFPNAKVADGEQFKENQAAGLNSILNILYVLLALSVVVSLFGIVNTLVLTVFERTRELGDAAGDRDDPAPGPADDPARERRHRADRSRARDHARDHLRRASGRTRGLHRVHAARRLADRLRARRDLRRGHRGDLPGAPRLTAQRAGSAAVRVGAQRYVRGCAALVAKRRWSTGVLRDAGRPFVSTRSGRD